jgi:hypothetical protein
MDMIKLINGNPVPYSEAAFRAANKHTVYGAGISSRHLNAQGVYRVTLMPNPEVPVGQKLRQDAMPAQDSDGNWKLGWTLEPLTTDEARALRDSLLVACDWTQVADAPVDQPAWAVYRQALRDVTTQAGFPDAVVWPVKPE